MAEQILDKTTSADGTPIAYWRSGRGPALLLEVPEEQIALLTSDQSWPDRVAAAHTLVRECRAEEAYHFDPARFAGLGLPTLLMGGAASPPDLVAYTAALADALPTAHVATMAGEGHIAMTTAPALFADELLAFLRAS
jgi:pimeloyl-ACP methyl ester carboxylesterase